MSVSTYSGQLSVFSIGGGSQLEFIETGQVEFNEDHREGAPASRFGGNTQGTKKSCRLTASLFSDSSTDIRVSHLGLSAATLGAVNLLTLGVSSLTFVNQMKHRMKPGAGELWAYPIVTDGFLTGQVEVGILSASVPQLLLDMFSSTYGDLNKTLDFTIGGVQIQVPLRAGSMNIGIEKDGLQMFSISLDDRSARAGVTVLPSGTTTLLEKSINQPKTALAFSFTGKAATSFNIAGNMVWDRYELQIRDNELVPSSLSFLSQGAWTSTSVP